MTTERMNARMTAASGANDLRRGTIEMSLAMLMSGTIGWLVVSSGQTPWNVVFFRCVFGAATLIAVCAALGFLKKRYFSWRVIGLAALGSVAIVGNWLLLFAAYSRASISMATTVYNTQPFMLVALGAIVLRERVSASTLAWLGIAFVGLVMVVRVEPAVLATPGQYLEGIAYALGAAFLYAISSIVTKRLQGTPPHLIAMLHVIFGIAMLAPFARFDAAPASFAGWADLVVLGVVNTGLMYVLLYGAIQKLPVATTGALSFIYPVVAIIVDWLAFGQRLAWLQAAGAVLILLAAAGVNLKWRIVPRRAGR
ncbi:MULTISPECIES: DMT family transporter [unclassified Caballeronia]|uniref:DMT family transporter n=1 Tax=unclassified Caballeronia TaxID=2646786 RepID=UPI000307DB25|nr:MULTISPECIES: DMT family transporter [unclassified Caballeronia]MCE4541672.1 DMT family transporter [Caballeronia sp. PC1]MCE4569284.1 DMT family transporter [Caballeronia sp. CLC5]